MVLNYQGQLGPNKKTPQLLGEFL